MLRFLVPLVAVVAAAAGADAPVAAAPAAGGAAAGPAEAPLGYHDPVKRRAAIVAPEVKRELALRVKAKTALAAHFGIPAQAPPGRPPKELKQKRYALPVYVNAYCPCRACATSYVAGCMLPANTSSCH